MVRFVSTCCNGSPNRRCPTQHFETRRVTTCRRPSANTATTSLHRSSPWFFAFAARLPTPESISTSWTARATSGWPTSSNACSAAPEARAEEHTSELQSHSDLVCRLLLEKKKKKKNRLIKKKKKKQQTKKKKKNHIK